MEIVKITYDNERQVLKLAVEYLQAGKVIAYPTETVYGLGCDATDELAIKQIYKIKGRPEKRALLFLVSSLKMAKQYVVFNQLANQLTKKYWPGPLSIILPLTVVGQKMFSRNDGGVRISSQPIATALVKKLGRPIISTSANLTGQPAAQDAQTVFNYFKDEKQQPDLILDAGKLKKSKGSTLVSLINQSPELLRVGDLKVYF